MKQILLSGLMFVLTYTASAQTSVKRLDSLAEFYAQTLDFNGSVLVTQKGKVLLNKGYGYQDKARNIHNTSESIYLIGSVTKQFTAEIVLMLGQEGKLSLSDKLSKYFPGYPKGDSITLVHLLTHTSGIFDYTRDEGWQAGKLDTAITDAQIFALFRDRQLNFSPGTKWSYSNSNYKLLSLIIERLTGKTYYQNVHGRIFQPLGMTHSGFDFTHLKDKNKTTGYYRVRNDSFLVSIIVDSTQTNAAGAIYSTTADMLKWHNALRTYKLLNKEWQEKAYVPYKRGYGYGWEIDSINGKRTLAHSGHIHGYNSNFCRVQEDDACIVVFTNLMKTAGDPIAYTNELLRAMYEPGYNAPAVRKEIPLADDIKKGYVGVYLMEQDTSMSFTLKLKDKQLYLTLTGQADVPILPQSKDLFFTKMVDAQVQFNPNKEGTYDLVLLQGGQKLAGRRIK